MGRNIRFLKTIKTLIETVYDQDTLVPKRARLSDMSKVLSTPNEIDERDESDATVESSDDTEQSSDEMEEVSQERNLSGEGDCVNVGNRVWRFDPALDVVDPRSIADTFTVIELASYDT